MKDQNEVYMFGEKLKPLKYSFFSWISNDKEKVDEIRRYLFKYFYTYPLRAACSVIVKHRDGSFKEEYVIPQLLLQWVIKDDDIDGIRYESCYSDEKVRQYCGHNLVLPTKTFDKDGYDKKLRECIRVGKPEIFDISELKLDDQIKTLLDDRNIKDNPSYFGMESISEEYEHM